MFILFIILCIALNALLDRLYFGDRAKERRIIRGLGYKDGQKLTEDVQKRLDDPKRDRLAHIPSANIEEVDLKTVHRITWSGRKGGNITNIEYKELCNSTTN